MENLNEPGNPYLADKEMCHVAKLTFNENQKNSWISFNKRLQLNHFKDEQVFFFFLSR